MKNKIIKYLLDINAIKIQTNELFLWSSGIKSPIYVDNRTIISFPEIRKIIEKELSNLIKINFPKVDFIIGVATAGIPHCAYVSNILNLPMGYVRSQSKNHGRKNIIEGNLSNAKNIVIIDDLFSTGMSTVKVLNILKEKNYNVLGVVSIFSYNLDILKDNFKNIKFFSLIDIDDLINVFLNEKRINKEDLIIIKDFIKNLNNISKKNLF